MNTILISVLVVAGCGLIIGLILSLAGKKLAVETDEREAMIREALPGNNCGGCGFPGCDGAAAAVASGKAPLTVCPVGGAPVAKKIGEIMGQEVEETERMTAYVRCQGTCQTAKKQYDYTGVESCAMANLLPGGGPKACSYGCLGFGDCVKACQFQALSLLEGAARVDREACKACGACVKACPRGLIELVPYEKKEYHAACSTKDRGKAVMEVCGSGCIGCRKCEKNCPSGAITVQGRAAHINYELCTSCGTCAEQCPRGCIVKW